jgi:hypothetical protein
MIEKPAIGTTVHHVTLGSCVVDNAELCNQKEDMVFVRFGRNLDNPTVSVMLKDLRDACMTCWGRGKRELGIGVEVSCDRCNGNGYL